MIGRFARALFARCFLFALSETVTLQLSQAEELPSNPAYQRVTANLDPGGLIYLFWNAEKVLGELDKKLESVRDTAVSDPTLLQEEKNDLRKNFDLGILWFFPRGYFDRRYPQKEFFLAGGTDRGRDPAAIECRHSFSRRRWLRRALRTEHAQLAPGQSQPRHDGRCPGHGRGLRLQQVRTAAAVDCPAFGRTPFNYLFEAFQRPTSPR